MHSGIFVTEPYYHDSLAFERLMNIVLDAGHRISTVLDDAAYDKKAYWNWLEELEIVYVANLRDSLNKNKRNSTCGKSKGCSSRAKHVRRVLEVGKENWRKEVGYSLRWRVEGTFSDLKRLFGDTVRARKRMHVADMIGWLVRCFNVYKETRYSL